MPNVRMIRVMCSGRVDPAFVLKAFSLGADGVMIAGCHPGECHYLEQNYKALRRFSMIKHTLSQFGVEEARVRLQWASAAEGVQLANAINEMIEQIRELGPLDWPSNWSENGRREKPPEEIIKEHKEAMEVPA
jgi:F420-non-reducing hydrogenase iron-sulfur subunit